ncbi:MAG TPA: glycosyltransferase family 4 protein [Acidimicrobiia bacterium]|nr:glycosyltransferase family 4 protein [Acidimicrobiia bacterium]
MIETPVCRSSGAEPRIKILVFTPYFPPQLGGLETLLGEYVGVLAERGHTVDVLSSTEPGDLPPADTWRGATVHRVPMHSPLYRQDVSKITQVRTAVTALKRDLAPDVLHVHMADGSVFFHSLTEPAYRGPTVVSVHSALAAAEARPGTPLYRVLTSADWVTGCSRSMLEQTCRAVPELAPRSSVVLNGMDASRIAASPLPAGAPVVLLLGRLVEEKGFDVALHACASVARALPDLRVAIAGAGPARGDLAALADDLGLTETVDWLGPLPMDEVPDVLGRATVVAVPSRYEEPFGLVAVEAGLAARPVVASRVGGLPEVVEHGRTGLLVTPDDADALAGALLTVLRDRELAATLGRAGRVRAERDLSIERHVEAFEDLFDKLVVVA